MINKIGRDLRIMWLRFLLWIEYKIGLFENTSRFIKSIGERDMESISQEYMFLVEITAGTGLDRDYLREVVMTRTTAAIIQCIRLAGTKTTITHVPEKQRRLIEDTFGIQIQETENGYKYGGPGGLFWSLLRCDKESRSRIELLGIAIKAAEERQRT